MKMHKVVRFLFGCIFFGVFVYYLMRMINSSFERAEELRVIPEIYALVIVAIVYCMWLFLAWVGWRIVLQCIIERKKTAPRLYSFYAYMKSLLTRYIPGKVWPAVFRAHSLHVFSLSRKAVLTSVFCEQFHFLMASVLLCALTLPFYYYNFAARYFFFIYSIMLCISGFCVFFWILRPQVILQHIRKYITTPHTEKDEVFDVSQIHVTGLWRGSFILFFLLALLQSCMVMPFVGSLVGDISITHILFISLAFPLARFIGQLGLVFPAGVGVREGAFLLLTAAFIPPEVATVIIIWLRIIQIMCEIILMATSYILLKVFNFPQRSFKA